jgi:hypothetical protein
MQRPVIGFLSDFGAGDASAAICRGVILGIARDAVIVDITHEVRKFAVRDGAFLLRNALAHLPVGVHLAVVDPGVGTIRRPIALACGRGDVLIGPDNGLLLPAAEALDGIVAARELVDRSLWLPTRTTSTFHGRDVFAPVAAHLASGTPLEGVGPAIEVASLVRLPWSVTALVDGALETGVDYIDTFGNVKLGARADELRSGLGDPILGEALRLTLGAHRRPVSVPWVRTFGDAPVGAAVLYDDSFGRLSLAVNQGSAATDLGLALDDPVSIRRAAGDS